MFEKDCTFLLPELLNVEAMIYKDRDKNKVSWTHIYENYL